MKVSMTGSAQACSMSMVERTLTKTSIPAGFVNNQLKQRDRNNVAPSRAIHQLQARRSSREIHASEWLRLRKTHWPSFFDSQRSGKPLSAVVQIGRASCRDRGGQYV